jgi:rhamnosyltransferase
MNINYTNIRYECSIVIPTKNGGDLFLRLLAKLKQQTLWNFVELIVVDSGSTDGTLDSAYDVGAKVIEIPPNEFNHGSTRDYGISLASSEFVILLVQDAEPLDSNLLESILFQFKNPEVAGVYGRQIPRPDADLLTKRNLNNWLTGRTQPELRRLQSKDWYEALSPLEKLFFCNFDNVCSAVRKSVWRQHNFGHVFFGEDIDWAERVLKSGFAIAYEPLAAVIHSHDRPILYEYKRTYVCHQKLYQQFRLQLVPTVYGIFKASVICTYQDLSFINHQDVALLTKFRLWLKSPLLNFFGALAQYQAVKDISTGKSKRVRGV